MQTPRPFVVAAGMSERGMRLAAEEADAIFVGGRDDAETVARRMITVVEECALDGLMLVFPDYLAGLTRLGAEILPRLRGHFAP